jgi:hypothetical protein
VLRTPLPSRAWSETLHRRSLPTPLCPRTPTHWPGRVYPRTPTHWPGRVCPRTPTHWPRRVYPRTPSHLPWNLPFSSLAPSQSLHRPCFTPLPLDSRRVRKWTTRWMILPRDPLSIPRISNPISFQRIPAPLQLVRRSKKHDPLHDSHCLFLLPHHPCLNQPRCP